MTNVTIIGKGTMGQVIAGIATKGGHVVQTLDSKDGDVAVEGDVVVLAVPYPAVAAVLAERGESLAGKVVVDITNPLDFTTFDSLVVPADGSAAAEIAAALGCRESTARSHVHRAVVALRAQVEGRR